MQFARSDVRDGDSVNFENDVTHDVTSSLRRLFRISLNNSGFKDRLTAAL